MVRQGCLAVERILAEALDKVGRNRPAQEIPTLVAEFAVIFQTNQDPEAVYAFKKTEIPALQRRAPSGLLQPVRQNLYC